MHDLPDMFSAVAAAARTIARCCDEHAGISDRAVDQFLTAGGWTHVPGAGEGRTWRHRSGQRVSRRDALAWALAEHREWTSAWPQFCRPCWEMRRR